MCEVSGVGCEVRYFTPHRYTLTPHLSLVFGRALAFCGLHTACEDGHKFVALRQCQSNHGFFREALYTGPLPNPFPRMQLKVGFLLTWALTVAAAQAALVTVQVQDGSGKQLPGAVVFLESREARQLAKPLAGAEIAQVSRQFVPRVLVVLSESKALL